jgi:hypothetical protein
MPNFLILAACTVVVFLIPESLYAWGPIAHLKMGLSLIENLKVMGSDAANIISNNPMQFLYGCLSADIIQAKRFVEYIHNCHNWDNAFKLLRSAKSSALKSFAYGYLAHLAADIVAHNCYIPAKLVETYSKRGLKHFVWEMRFDWAVKHEKCEKVLKEIIKMDHSLEDDLMNELLQTTLFSFKTNKRIFSGLLTLQRVRRWQLSMKEAYLTNNYFLSDEEIDYYFKLSLNAMIGFLIDLKSSKYLKYDPMGKDSLEKAKKIMRDFKRKGKTGIISGIDSPVVQDNISFFKTDFLKGTGGL